MTTAGGWLRPPHASAISAHTGDGSASGINNLDGEVSSPETPVLAADGDKEGDSARPGAYCPGCALRDHQIDLLVRSRGAAIEAAFASSARARAAELALGRQVAGPCS